MCLMFNGINSRQLPTNINYAAVAHFFVWLNAAAGGSMFGAEAVFAVGQVDNTFVNQP